MKVMHVLGSNSFSGAENVACQIIKMTTDFVDSTYVSRNGTIKCVLDLKKIRYVMLDKLSVKELKRVLKIEKPDLVHAHDMRASLICSVAIKNDTKFISHIHNNNYNSRKLTLKSILYAYAANKADHIIWVSKSSYDGYYFSQLFKNKSSVLYNVINTYEIIEKIKNEKKSKLIDIAFVGRMCYPKNPQKFVNIIEKSREYFPNIKAVMIGTGDSKDEIGNLITKKKLEKNISLLGYVDNPYKIMCHCKLLLITSEWEGTPMCALEAMFLGLPIISTPVDGMRELIQEGVNGFFARDVSEFTKYIIRLLKNETLYNKMSKEAQNVFKIVNDYQKYVEQIQHIYTK